MEDLMIYFLVFITYSFIGWIIEIISVAFEKKKIINRGFLIGPYCPIYGCGALLMTFLLRNYQEDIVGLFVKAILICSILEYFTSYIMEKLFKTRWWDYSHIKFNINGRICLETMIPFGIGGVIMIKFFNPFLFGLYGYFPFILLSIISVVIFILIVTDLIISFNIINGFKKSLSVARIDNTEEISNKVKEVLDNKSYLKKRLVKAFPNVDLFKKYIK